MLDFDRGDSGVRRGGGLLLGGLRAILEPTCLGNHVVGDVDKR